MSLTSEGYLLSLQRYPCPALIVAGKLSDQFLYFKLRLAKNLCQHLQLTWQPSNCACNDFCHMLRFAIQCFFLTFFHCFEIWICRVHIGVVFKVPMEINTKHFFLVSKHSYDSQLGLVLSMCLLPFPPCTSSDLSGLHHYCQQSPAGLEGY